MYQLQLETAWVQVQGWQQVEAHQPQVEYTQVAANDYLLLAWMFESYSEQVVEEESRVLGPYRIVQA